MKVQPGWLAVSVQAVLLGPGRDHKLVEAQNELAVPHTSFRVILDTDHDPGPWQNSVNHGLLPGTGNDPLQVTGAPAHQATCLTHASMHVLAAALQTHHKDDARVKVGQGRGGGDAAKGLQFEPHHLLPIIAQHQHVQIAKGVSQQVSGAIRVHSPYSLHKMDAVTTIIIDTLASEAAWPCQVNQEAGN